VRRIKELDSERFELRNPAWQQTLEAILSRVASNIGVDVSAIKAEPHKLLLYQRGAQIRPEKETSQSSPGTAAPAFGTLEVCLPSKHEGGDLCIAHNGKTQVLETAKSSEHGYSYIAWYLPLRFPSFPTANRHDRYTPSATTHSAKPITSGHRITLTYHLTTPSALQPAPPFSSPTSRLHQTLTSWDRQLSAHAPGHPARLAYALDHTYADATLGFAHLRDADLFRAFYLHEASAGTRFGVFVANREGGAGRLTRVVALDGGEVARGAVVRVREDEVVGAVEDGPGERHSVRWVPPLLLPPRALLVELTAASRA
jgi:hypothetical protein